MTGLAKIGRRFGLSHAAFQGYIPGFIRESGVDYVEHNADEHTAEKIRSLGGRCDGRRVAVGFEGSAGTGAVAPISAGSWPSDG